MKPSKELLKLAKEKAQRYFNTNNPNSRKSIRLTADDKSYYLFYIGGFTYIGTYNNEPMPKFFKNRSAYDLINHDKNKVIATMQKL